MTATWAKVPCPTCDGLKQPKAKSCVACYLAGLRANRKVYRCSDCGGELPGNNQKRCRPCHDAFRNPFPRERVKVVVDRWADKWRSDRGLGPNEPPGKALHVLAERAGVSRRLIYRIYNGASASERGSGEFLTLDTVDRLFCAMHCVWLFQVPPEEGGFADIYHSIPYDDEDEELLAA